MSRIAIAVAASLTAALALALPPRRLPVPLSSWPLDRTIVPGAFHIHTARSDGSGTIDDVAAAAARAHLQFVVATDHGDGTRVPDAPRYRSGVLWLDGVEISTAGGHYAAIGMRRAPYPLAGEAGDVVEDVARLGGFGVAAHGDSPKEDLRWNDWNLPFDGVEWMNLDTAWRSSTSAALARAFVAYFFRAPQALAFLAARPVAMMQRWDELTARRRVVAIASTDAHARIPLTSDGRGGAGVVLPTYEACFRTVTTRVELDAPLTGDAELDAQTLVTALRAGHHYTALDALALPAGFQFTATAGGRVAHQGDAMPVGDPVTFIVRADAPRSARLLLLRNGVPVQQTVDTSLTYVTSKAGVYRVEARLGDEATAPWIVSNPIYVGPLSPPVPRAVTRGTFATDLVGQTWTIERDQSSTAALTRGADLDRLTIGFRYGLGSGSPADQFAGLVAPIRDGLAMYDRITFAARASHPLRVVVQLRAVGNDHAPGWRRSVYLDSTPRTVTIFFKDMHAVPPEAPAPPPLDSIGALMFIVDTNNTTPGSSGEVELSEVALER